MLRLDNLSKRYGHVEAVRAVSLDIPAGELLTLLGPSGCGKTTTLRLIAGFETPTSGRITISGRDVTAVPPQKRAVGMVFQNYALFPHLDVAANVGYGLVARRIPAQERTRRVEHALGLVDLEGYGSRRVQELSGGQQQRVALARALAPEPPVLLLDEPLSNLDATLRERTRDELRKMLERLGVTAVFVTHDQEEAFALSDRIALMNAGVLQQAGTAEELYDAPANRFVASFIGRANFLRARAEQVHGGEIMCRFESGARWLAHAGTAGVARGEEVDVMVRPESLCITAAPADGLETGSSMLPGTVTTRRFAGAIVAYEVQCVDGEITLHVSPRLPPVSGPVLIAPKRGIVPLVFPASDAR
jgi:ABC-type Fe3+/spermidine/putrescine transport system ATPase subunit